MGLKELNNANASSGSLREVETIRSKGYRRMGGEQQQQQVLGGGPINRPEPCPVERPPRCVVVGSSLALPQAGTKTTAATKQRTGDKHCQRGAVARWFCWNAELYVYVASTSLFRSSPGHNKDVVENGETPYERDRCHHRDLTGAICGMMMRHAAEPVLRLSTTWPPLLGSYPRPECEEHHHAGMAEIRTAYSAVLRPSQP